MKELIKIQSQLKAPKNLYNGFGKYKYRSAESILEAVKPLLAENECTLTISDEIVLVGDRFYIKATATLRNKDGVSVSTTAYAREAEEKKGMDESQITGMASSYARKYALSGLFCLDDNKDADALNTFEEYTQKSEKKTLANDAALTAAIEEAMKQTDVAKLEEVWNAHPEYHNTTSFKSAVKTTKAFLEKKGGQK